MTAKQEGKIIGILCKLEQIADCVIEKYKPVSAPRKQRIKVVYNNTGYAFIPLTNKSLLDDLARIGYKIE